MAVLPYSRVVNVTLTRNDRFPARRGFGVALFLQGVAISGQVDAAKLTKVYGSVAEVAADFATTTDAYKAAVAAFSQNPRPLQIKIGYYPTLSGDAAAKKAALTTALNALYEYDPGWYWLTVDSVLRADTDDVLDAVVDWVEAKNRLAILDSNNADLKDIADDTNVAARHKGTVERTAVFYHDDTTAFPAIAQAAALGTRNFDEANSAYTAKFKKIAGLAPVNIGSAAVQAITGFTPAIGQATATGHLANTYVDIGGQNFVVEGSVLTPNVFIDEIHATDWIIARTEEEMLGILLNNDRVPMTNEGMDQLASGVRTVMRQAFRAGLVANDLNPITSEYEPAVRITVPDVFDIPESQRKSRVAPAIQCTFRYAGAVHYTTVNYDLTY